MRVLMVASEVVPFAKSGGLADVAGVLPKELKKLGVDIRVVMPRYKKIDKSKLKRLDKPLGVPMGVIGELWSEVYEGRLPNSDVPIYFIEFNQYFDRDNLYNDDSGEGFLDNDNRFVFLSRASLQLCKKLNFKPDILHINDWQTSAVVPMLKSIYKDDKHLKDSASLLTIHNAQYQGKFYSGLMNVLDVGWEHFNYRELEQFDMVNLLKGAIANADIITTVSKKYAKEIETNEYGYGLEQTLLERDRDLYGILNGVDYSEWSPERDSYIASNYSIENLEGKDICKEDLQKSFNLPKLDIPIIGMVTRLADQKGVDIVAKAVHRILDLRVQFVLVGSGDRALEEFFSNIDRENFGCYIGYSNELAHKVEAGSDFFLMPSRFEPCGLNQMYSLKYGTLPIVRATGGLDDTIENFDSESKSGDGFKFEYLSEDAIFDTVGWAIYTYYNDRVGMKNLIQNAMKKSFTWRESAKEYLKLYKLAKSKKLNRDRRDKEV